MHTYIVLIRGINVGGKNKVPMALLREHLTALGYTNVITYIASGNAVVRSAKSANSVKQEIETMLAHEFASNEDVIKVLVLTVDQLEAIIASKPEGFGNQPETYYSDAIFLIDINTAEALPVFNPREGVDAIWPGDGIIYSQRLGELRTKSRLSAIAGTAAYKSMTIRTWGTVTKLLEIARALKA